MANADQIRALMRSYASGDRDRFSAIALQIAAQSARQGQHALAEEIKSLVSEARSQHHGTLPYPIAKPRAEVEGLVRASFPKVQLGDMVLDRRIRKELDDLIHQQRQRELLREHSLEPRRKVLLVGPPGCGKSMTASALANACSMPLLYVQLHLLMSRYLGETAAKLHQIFAAMTETRGVYFFDEFDAIGATRQTNNDVGEMRRVLNTFLQLVEQDQSDSILVAATNLHSVLDEALFRRFDTVIRYDVPDAKQATELMNNRLAPFLPAEGLGKTSVSASRGLSHAEIVRACEDAARDVVLTQKSKITNVALRKHLLARKAMRAAS
jgi:SpoVK/Ycf46/Vps4 family AAA+-type ATPase